MKCTQSNDTTAGAVESPVFFFTLLRVATFCTRASNSHRHGGITWVSRFFSPLKTGCGHGQCMMHLTWGLQVWHPCFGLIKHIRNFENLALSPKGCLGKLCISEQAILWSVTLSFLAHFSAKMLFVSPDYVWGFFLCKVRTNCSHTLQLLFSKVTCETNVRNWDIPVNSL